MSLHMDKRSQPRRTYLAEWARVITGAVGGMTLLALVLLVIATTRSLAAPIARPPALAEVVDLSIRVTTMPFFDPQPGLDSRTVYFNNSLGPDAILLDFEISGVPTLTLDVGPAWSNPARRYTSMGTPWQHLVVHAVQQSDSDSPTVPYSVTDALGESTGLVITFARDVVPPVVFTPTIVESSTALYPRGATLYYTNTAPVPQHFALAGYASDDEAGVARVSFSSALGHQPPDITGGFPYYQSSGYPIVPGQTAGGNIVATVVDRVENSATQVYTYVLDSTAPTVELDAPAAWPHPAPIPITWTATDTQSGVASTRLYYRRQSQDPGWVDSGLALGGESGIFAFAHALGITYDFAAVSIDHVGNASVLPEQGISVVVDPAHTYLPLVLSRYPPPPEGNITIAGGAQTVHGAAVDLTIDASVSIGTVTHMRFSNDGANWSGWEPYATQKSWALAGGTNGLRTVSAQFRGSLGGISGIIADRTFMVLNGSFEQGASVPGWVLRQSPLPLNIVTSVAERPSGSTPPPDGAYALLLGNPSYPCGPTGVPLGYAGIQQTFELPTSAQRLTFRYIIWSQDASSSGAYDRFEVYIQDTAVFYDGNMVNTGLDCAKWWRVPSQDNPVSGATSGWATATIDLSAYTGQNVTVSFQNHSRLDGWYNTYTVIDDITIEGNW